MGGPVAKSHAIGTLVIGVIEIVLALIIIICSFVLSGKANMSASLTPYWAGIPFLVPGILGVVVGFTKNFCAMVAFMVLNIITFVLEGIGCILIAIVVAIYAGYADNGCTRYLDTCVCTSNGNRIVLSGTDTCDVIKEISTILYVLVVFLVFAAAVTLAGSILGCIGTCCKGNEPYGQHEMK